MEHLLFGTGAAYALMGDGMSPTYDGLYSNDGLVVSDLTDTAYVDEMAAMLVNTYTSIKEVLSVEPKRILDRLGVSLDDPTFKTDSFKEFVDLKSFFLGHALPYSFVVNNDLVTIKMVNPYRHITMETHHQIRDKDGAIEYGLLYTLGMFSLYPLEKLLMQANNPLNLFFPHVKEKGGNVKFLKESFMDDYETRLTERERLGEYDISDANTAAMKYWVVVAPTAKEFVDGRLR